MKKILFLLAVAYCTLATSQEFYLQGGVSISNFNLEDEPFNSTEYSFEKSSRLGLLYGLTASLPIGEKLSFYTGVIYVEKGIRTETQEEFFGGELNLKTDMRIGYAMIPLNLAYSISESFYIEAGPFFSMGVGGGVKYKFNFDGEEDTDGQVIIFNSVIDSSNDDDAVVRRLDYGVNAGIGFKSGLWIVKANYQLGLENIMPKYSNDILDPSDEQPGYVKTRSFQISIGRKISFKSNVE